jgi:hypothetical protein
VRPVESPAELDVHLVAFSGERDALEQLVSLRSLLRHLGRPSRITLGSDGSHSPESLERLRALYPELELIGPETYLTSTLPDPVHEYAARHPLGKKLAFVAGLRTEGTTVYADSDVLFFPGATELRELLAGGAATPRYLLDCAPALDERVLPADLAVAPPVNSGFWIADRALDWDAVLPALDAAGGEFSFHTEQTLFHIAMHRAGGEHVDPARYVMEVDDRFDYRTRREERPIVLRHYVSNIRHQLWLNAEV